MTDPGRPRTRRPSRDDPAFLLALSDRLRPLADVDAIKVEASNAVGEYLGAARVGYAECAPDGETVLIGRHFVDGAPPLGPSHQLRDYGADLAHTLRTGATVARPDLAADPSLTLAERSAYAAIGLASMVDVPLVKDGRLVAILFVHYTEPRSFSPGELALLEDVAERTWAAVERGRAETAVVRSHDTFLGLIEEAPFGVYLVDADFRLVQASAGARPAFGDLDPLLGRDFGDVLRHVWPEPFASEAIGRFRHTLDTGEPYHSLDTTQERNDRPEVQAYDWQTKRVELPDGRPGVVCYFYDLTPIRVAEAAQREAVTRYEQQVRLFEGVVSTTPDFVYLFDLDGRFVYANRRLLEVWGVPLDQAVGRTPRELGYEQWHHDMHMREIAEVIETRRPIKGEVPFRAPLTGIFGVYEYIFTPVMGPDGRVELIAGTTRDVTDHKRVEEALQEREARLEEALAVKDEFLGLVSHELRTPLTIILGMSRILASAGPDTEARRSIAADIADSAEVLSDLVEAMLLLARIDSREAGQLREPVVLERAARSVVERVSRRSPDHEVRLEVRASGDVVEVQRTWLERVIENLVTNAIKYAPAGTAIEVVVERDGGAACVRVLDRGSGVDEAELPRLFEPFYRTDSARERAAGAGLGLAVARRIVELMDGRIWGRPRDGGGSEFGFAVPVASLSD